MYGTTLFHVHNSKIFPSGHFLIAANSSGVQFLHPITKEELHACAYSEYAHDLAVKSKKYAEAVNGGDPLWIKVDNMTISLSKDEVNEIDTWGDQVLASTCIRIKELGGAVPSSCPF